MKHAHFYQSARSFAIALIFLISTGLTHSSNINQQQEITCEKIQLLPDTYIAIPTSTEKNRNSSTIFLSTDKKYDYTSRVCIEIKNHTGIAQDVVIRLENPRVRHVELISRTEAGVSQLAVSGLDYPLKNWQTIGSEILFNRTIENGDTQKFELGIGSIFPYNSNIVISGTEVFFGTVIYQQLATGLLIGFIFALVFYTAAIGISAKDKTYLFLFGSTVFVTMLQLNDIGLLYALWPDAMYWNNISSGIYALLSTACGVGLARGYLLTAGNTPRADRLLHFFFWYLLIVGLPLPFLENDDLFLFLYALPTILLILPSLVITSIIRIRQNYTPAKMYLLALAMPILAGLVIFLMYIGIIASSPMERIFPLTGTALQLIFFAIALGERINWLKDQQSISLQQALASEIETTAKKNFLAHISHELRTPLAGIIGLADLAKKNPLYATNKPLIDGINESAGYLLNTTNTLLDHARLDAEKWPIANEKFSPSVLIKKTADSMKKLANKKNVSISVNVDGKAPEFLYGDHEIISKILEIIIGYSINSTDNGNIHINFETFFKNRNSLYLRFDIINTGEVISDEFKSKIFEIFELSDSSTTREQQGLGLDLSLSKKFCDLLGGEMGYDSNPQHGSVFWFVIPCSLPPADTNASSIVNADHKTSSQSDIRPSKRLLVAEDDETLQLIISSQLDTLRLKHTVFPNGKPLVEEYINNHQDIDMVLLDWNMPICNAREAIAAIRQFESSNALPPVAIAVLSAHDKHNTKEMNLSPEIRILQKPVTTDDLSKLIFPTQKS